MIKDPQANAIVEQVHQVETNMIQTSNLGIQDICTPSMIYDFTANVGWEICSAHHTLLGTAPCAENFG